MGVVFLYKFLFKFFNFKIFILNKNKIKKVTISYKYIQKLKMKEYHNFIGKECLQTPQIKILTKNILKVIL